MYFKILDNSLIHYGYTYHEGLNVDPKPFGPTPDCGGGLFFTDEKHILEFCNYGGKVAEVIIPEGEEVIQVEEKYKAHRIILGKIKELWTVDTLNYLIGCGVDIHKNEDILYWSVEAGHLETIKFLIDCGLDIHINIDIALRRAAGYGYLDIVEYLIKEGADIHTYNEAPLHLAASNGHLSMVKYLIEHGANPYADDNCALCYAAGYGHFEIVKYLIGLGRNIIACNKGLSWAIDNEQLEIARYLLNYGADVNYKDPYTEGYEYTGLYWAIKNHDLEMVKLLIEYGADINDKGILELESKKEYSEMMDYLKNIK